MKPDPASSVQKGLDAMQNGVCISGDDGIPVLINAKMRDIADVAFVSRASFTGGLDEKDLKDGCRTAKNGKSVFLILPDGSAWNIKNRTFTEDGVRYNECTAYDVTELYGKSLELKRRNAHLSAVNEKICEYSKSLDTVIRDRELLDAKIRIHDDVGRALLSLRSYLNREDKDKVSLLKLWRTTVSMLRRETAPDTSGDRMEALSEAAKAVGVTLHRDGEIPDDPVIRDISAAAIRECLTNTVKHADGHNVYIKTSLSDEIYTIKIKNDGKKPDKPVEETGGLHTLRKSVERYGGNMTVAWENGFELTVTLGFGEDGK